MSAEEKRLGESLIATHQQAQRIHWRPIAEAPRDGTTVLLFWPCVQGGDYYVGRWTESYSLHEGLACWIDDDDLRIGGDDCFSHFAELTEP